MYISGIKKERSGAIWFLEKIIGSMEPVQEPLASLEVLVLVVLAEPSSGPKWASHPKWRVLLVELFHVCGGA